MDVLIDKRNIFTIYMYIEAPYQISYNFLCQLQKELKLFKMRSFCLRAGVRKLWFQIRVHE